MVLSGRGNDCQVLRFGCLHLILLLSANNIVCPTGKEAPGTVGKQKVFIQCLAQMMARCNGVFD